MKPKTDVTFEGGFEVSVSDVELWWLLRILQTNLKYIFLFFHYLIVFAVIFM